MLRSLASVRAAVLVAALVFALPSFAAVRHVPAQYAQIQSAMVAAAPGDTVLVAAGTYFDCTHPTEGAGSTPACVIMASGVTLRGAGVDATIIDAQSLGRGIFIENVSGCRVENLQVRAAYAAIYGAGILVRNAGATVAVTDVKVTQCTDGGVICINSASPTLTRVEISHNAAKQGGGLAIEESSSPQVVDCNIHHNSAPSGAGVFIRTNCAPVIDGCTIADNTITADFGNGGGIAAQNAAPVITGCTITGNTTLGYGGGVAFVQGATGLMEDCRIEGNDAAGTYSLGGGVAVSQSSPTLRGLVIVNNSCTGFYAEGGGLDISFTPAPVLENCTIASNATSANGFGGGMSVQFGAAPSVTRCIIAGATAGQAIYCLAATPVVACSDLWGNAGGDAVCGTDGGGNFSLDPQFCDAGAGSFGLQGTSPCAPGNHGGSCAAEVVGALPAGCGASPVPMPAVAGLVVGCQPNPFNPATTVWFEQAVAGPVQVDIYDVRGRRVDGRTFADAPAGRTSFTWRGVDDQGRLLPSGVYLCRVSTARDVSTRRMSLIR
ncbi:MAG TPA: right-handed parallel beta-helix repeat-containing protein [Candidatus Krumholzibacteria bacterium]|nr:right-handed parallel beta-helix repeat-containing protein [Candidatus Krumholzibacteria bacterium]